MTVSVYIPVALSVLVAAISWLMAARLSPTRGTVITVVGAAVLCAAGTTWALVLLALSLLGFTTLAVEEATERGVVLVQPVPGVVGVLAAVALTYGVVRVVRVARARWATRRELRKLCLSCAPGELAVVPVAEPHAFAVPGRPGRVLVTQGLLALLDGKERRVVLAHERAHLAGRHHGLRATVEVCAAINPMLVPVREAVAFLVERSADEHAATVSGSREVTARALAKAALAEASGPRHAALGFIACAVSARVAALHAAPPRPDRLLPGGFLLLGAGATVAAVQATLAFYRLVHWLWLG
ncbi:MAG TPA: M56 family metallopeptidase [Pseudonocardia sp.]|uniref:M56 family metallopeptidase n=1 Tax=Pseudonocardia sp. TaxID=60912 RepID=UPI002C90AB0E|nr:M56 family metallopeptidase [Pseudonocardia sp.]HTF53065.1 M56 family metallopeptidase [Pseudonocardia sp.]